MGVVFDEVIANVEAPAAAPQEMDVAEQPSQEGENNNEEKIIKIIEIQQRKARRLWAD